MHFNNFCSKVWRCWYYSFWTVKHFSASYTFPESCYFCSSIFLFCHVGELLFSTGECLSCWDNLSWLQTLAIQQKDWKPTRIKTIKWKWYITTYKLSWSNRNSALRIDFERISRVEQQLLWIYIFTGYRVSPNKIRHSLNVSRQIDVKTCDGPTDWFGFQAFDFINWPKLLKPPKRTT